MTEFNAWQLSRAWASVALAQGTDDARPALYRSTLIEMFDSGIRLVSTDSYVLLKAWVANEEFEGEPEPPVDELPVDVAICSDRDHRVLALMKYVQGITKQDGADSSISMKMGLGEATEGRQSTLEGLSQSTVWFHLTEQYDERIESPVFEGVFPNWRPLWAGHRWTPTSLVGFGANGILRLGKLSQLWDKAVIEFELGGSTGVSKINIVAPDVFVSGLVMPVSEPSKPVPPSPEGEVHELAEALDDWISDVLRTEVKSDVDSVTLDASLTQMYRCMEHAIITGYASRAQFTSTFGMDDDRADEILAEFVERQLIAEPDKKGKHALLVDAEQLDHRWELEFGGGPPPEPEDLDGEEPV